MSFDKVAYMREYNRKYRAANREQLLASDRKYREANPEKVALAKKRWYEANRTEHNAGSRSRYRLRKAESNEYSRIYRNARRKIDPNFKLAAYLRTRLYLALKKNRRTGSAVRDLGCTVAELRSYLEALFLPGMTWGNAGEWHIDHIKPLASFDLTNREQLLEACHYTNLQPLWATDNIRKGAREVCHFDSN